MLNLLSRALAGMVLDRDARDAMRDAGGLASTIQGSADMRAVIQHLAAQQQLRPAIGATPLTSPSTNRFNPLADPAVLANAAALQAALMGEILAQARSAAGGQVAIGLSTPSTYSPAQPVRYEPTLAPARAARPAPAMTQPMPAPMAMPTNGSATLQAALMAQALASAREAISDSAPASAPMRAPVAAAPTPMARPASGKRLSPSERTQLIQNALKVHSAKQTILANLSDEQRAKLTELASKLFDPTAGAATA